MYDDPVPTIPASNASASTSHDREAALDVGERVLLLLRSAEDASLAHAEIVKGGCRAEICADLTVFLDEIVQGVGAAVIAEEVLTDGMAELFRVFDEQSTWSDLPVIVLVREHSSNSMTALRAFERHPKIKTTLLQRPVPAISLLSAVRSGIKARRRQYQVRDLLLQLNDDVRQRDEFLAMLGHELRNPITSIGYVAEIFDMGGEQLTAERVKWGAGVITRQIRHLSQLLNQLLDVARVQSGKIELESASLDLAALARQCIEAYEPRARRRKLTLSLPEDPVMVRGDRVRLTQAVTNLLDNALKYTEEQGNIDVSIFANDGQAALAVADDGRGIAKEIVPHVFEPFFQGENRNREEAGLGLGLTLVDNIVRLHGGTIEAHSEGAGCGAKFVVKLPVSSPEPAPENLPVVPPLRLLIVEDNEELADVFSTLLRELGHETHVIHEGSGAADLVLQLHPDMVFIDVGLPDIGGDEVAYRIRDRLADSAPPLVALTGYPRQHGAATPFDDYLLKPVGRERVERVFRDLVVNVRD